MTFPVAVRYGRAALPVPSPFHPRTAPLCTSYLWKEWAGYYAVRSFDTCHEPEYMAFRHAAGLLDVTALYKYEVRGADAAAYLSRIMVKDLSRLRIGRVTYLCWCDDDGKVLDDGTITHLGENHYRVTAAEPCYRWFCQLSRGYRVEIEDVSEKLGALALQGPNSAAILGEVTDGAIEGLRFFGHRRAKIARASVDITRTGYTGDLGYEIWMANEDALTVWDALAAIGPRYRLQPAGLDALDVARVEAGFIMNGVDYFSANHCLVDSRKSTPLELGLGWAIQLDRDPFVGQAALAAEAARGPGVGDSWSGLRLGRVRSALRGAWIAAADTRRRVAKRDTDLRRPAPRRSGYERHVVANPQEADWHRDDRD